jgi:acyl-homoserine lactone acylase PvdQ
MRRLGTRTVRSLRARALKAAGLAVLACLALLALWVVPAGATELEDFSGGAFQILPPGAEGGEAPGKYSTDQAKLYEKLTPKGGNITPELIEKDYLPEKFGDNAGGGVLRVEKPEAGLEIVRDKHDIPHIYGTTRAAVMFGSGWVAAKDRGLLLKLGIGPAYTAALGVPGINAFGLLIGKRSFKPSAEAIAYVENQKKVLEEKGPEGMRVISDLEAWIDGVNAWSAANPGFGLQKFKFADAVAGFAFIGSIFGNGGGGEVFDSEYLAKLENKFGETAGKQIFADLRRVNDPEAPTTGHTAFPYDKEPTGATPGALLVEPGSVSPAGKKAAEVLKASRKRMSNFLLVGAKDAANGHPKAVMGPQLGYYYPEIVFQADMHGPGIDAQGVVAPISPYVFIGRGKDFAWSLTSEDAENTQTFLEKLCEPKGEKAPTRESDYYLYNGECIQFHTFDAGELGAGGGESAHEVFFKESVHGPISGTVLVGGQPYAISTDRATRGREPAGEVAFSELDSDQVHNPQQFFEAANNLETTFNMAYADDEHIAFFSTGRLPITAPGTNPSLPTLGTGEYDWKGFLGLEEHPHEIDPASGYLTNWNNKPAPEWGAASDEWGEGPIHRVQLFKGFKEGMTEASDVSIMNKAATQDLRAVEIWPTIEEVLNTPGTEPSKLAKEAQKTIRKWVEKGASRFGKEGPKAPAAAILDAAWTPMAKTVMEPVLGEALTNELQGAIGINNGENSGGSSYGGGWYGYVYKSLREVLGDKVEQPNSRGYCGNGSLEACRNSLWAALQSASESLSAANEGHPMKTWRAQHVRIEFSPNILFHFNTKTNKLEEVTMSWTNRSTFQQVIEFTGHAPE